MLAAGIAALLAPAAARSHGWPIAPGDVQHAIRGAFDDPRQHLTLAGLAEQSFHFGGYLFWLARDLDTSSLAPARFRVEVEASDTQGNTGTGSLAFVVAAQSRKTTNWLSRYTTRNPSRSSFRIGSPRRSTIQEAP